MMDEIDTLLKETERLEAEIDRLKVKMGEHGEHIAQQFVDIGVYLAENANLKQALEFYGNENNYSPSGLLKVLMHGEWEIELGKTARDALHQSATADHQEPEAPKPCPKVGPPPNSAAA